MGALDTGVLVADLVLAAVAVIANFIVSLHMRGRLRLLLGFIATLALMYATGYLWLLQHPGEVEAWSRVMRPIQIVSWLAPWIAQPVVFWKYLRVKADEIVHHAEETAAQYVPD